MTHMRRRHIRTNGWCDTCGGTGEPNIEHSDRLSRPEDAWVIRSPEGVSWTPDEIKQIGAAAAAFGLAMPGLHREIIITGLSVLPADWAHL